MLLGACGGAGPPAAPTTTVPPPTSTTVATHFVTGTFLLRQEGNILGATCMGRDGYDDIKPTTQVTIKDQAGMLLAVTSLGSGAGVAASGKPGVVYCRWSFSLSDVPEVGFYQFETGRRGAVTYSAADMRQKSWHVDLSLGT